MASSRVVCRVDLGQLAKNFAVLKKSAHSCGLMPVLKYDAYGIGAEAVGTHLKTCGAVRFAGATVEEAVELKKLGLPVQILGLLPPDEVAEAVAHGIICPVADEETAKRISAEAVRQNKEVRIAVKLDTGMGRLGFRPEECAAERIAGVVKLPNLVCDSLFSHFSMAAQPDPVYCDFQIRRFLEIHDQLAQAGIRFPYVHHAAGDAILKVPQSTLPPFNLARPGGSMYGEDFVKPCRQILTLVTRIGALRSIPKGFSTGYYRLFIADYDRKVAVLEAGYADGIPLALSNRGAVLIRGRRCPILGRISMDYTVVDVTQVPEAAVGDEVVLLGRQGGEEITVADWAKMKGTHGHDIWCSIGHRVRREYIAGAEIREMNFVQMVKSGRCTIADIDDYIDRWHDEYTGDLKLYEYLGMTEQEYDTWLVDPGSLKAMFRPEPETVHTAK